MVVLVTYKIEEDTVQSQKGARMVTTLFIDFSRHPKEANSEVSSGILAKFKLLWLASFYATVASNKGPSPSRLKVIIRIEARASKRILRLLYFTVRADVTV